MSSTAKGSRASIRRERWRICDAKTLEFDRKNQIAGEALSSHRSRSSPTTHSAELESLPLPGPVFIHEEQCERYAEDGGFPAELRSHALTLNVYAHGRHLRAQEYVDDGRVEPVLERLLARADVDYIHVRDTQAGCFDFTVERAGSD